MTEYC